MGSDLLAGAKEGPISAAMREHVMQVVRTSFRPEFINRLDEIILFKRLEKQVMRSIVDIQLAWLAKRLEERHITLSLDDKAKDWLAEEGYDSVYGARPLKRVIQRELQNKLASKILAGDIADGSTVKVQGWEGGLKVG
jgi:ATP-dependent Clp protease ATP-binding subunit ClpB